MGVRAEAGAAAETTKQLAACDEGSGGSDGAEQGVVEGVQKSPGTRLVELGEVCEAADQRLAG